jgi:hypothetical protein
MVTDIQGDLVSELGLSMSIRQKRSNAALETRLSILFRNAGDFELQFYELKKLRYLVRQAELSARSASRLAGADSFSEACPHSGARGRNAHQLPS